MANNLNSRQARRMQQEMELQQLLQEEAKRRAVRQQPQCSTTGYPYWHCSHPHGPISKKRFEVKRWHAVPAAAVLALGALVSWPKAEDQFITAGPPTTTLLAEGITPVTEGAIPPPPQAGQRKIALPPRKFRPEPETFATDVALPAFETSGNRSRMPIDPQNRYGFGRSPLGNGQFAEAPSLAERCARPEIVAALYKTAINFKTMFASDGLQMVFGDADADNGGHATHKGGGYMDIYTSLSNMNAGAHGRLVDRDGPPHSAVAQIPFVQDYLATNPGLTYEQSIALWMGMQFVDSGVFNSVVYEDTTVNDAVNLYAAERGITFVSYALGPSNTTHWFHYHVQGGEDGSSRSCPM